MIANNTLGPFYDWVDAVQSGKQIACRQVKASVARFVRDRQREGNADFPYYFDEDLAQQAIDWFPSNLRHTVGRFSTHRFELEPWQMFGIGNIHGWRRLEDGTRRFRRVFWSMARKNGKSTLAAGMAIHGASHDIDPITKQKEATAQVILAAAKREQADAVTFSEVQRMVESATGVLGNWNKKYQKITFTENEGSISTVGSNKPYDGLNPSIILLDETHAWTETHRPFYDTMLTGGASRSQPLTVCTTTAGDKESHIWLDEYNYSCGVADGTIDDDRWFSFVFELDAADDVFDETVWEKANPNLGVSVSLDYLRDNAKTCRVSKVGINRFTRYHTNRIVTNVETAFDLDAWDKCEGELSDWSTADAIGGGVDLGSRDDLCAYGLVARFPVEGTEEEEVPTWRYEIRSQSFIAGNTPRDLSQAPFAEYVHQDLLKVSDRPIGDMRDSLLAACRDFGGIHEIAYDPYNGQQFSEEVENEGITIASMAQTTAMFHEPIEDFRQAMQDGRIRHDGNPLIRWFISNAKVTSDRQLRWMFCKKSSAEKIDGLVAITMGFRRAALAPGRAIGDIFVSSE